MDVDDSDVADKEKEFAEHNTLDDYLSNNLSELEIDKLKVDSTVYYGFGNKYSHFFSNLHVL